jgi:hypothetical protein
MRIAASWWLTVLFCLLLTASYLAVVFGERPFASWMAFLLHSPAGLALSIGLALNIAIASIRVVLQRLRKPLLDTKTVMAMDTWFAVPASGSDAAARAAAWMAGRGFPATVTGNTVTAIKGKYSFLPGTLMRAGIVLLMAALLISAHTRKTGELVLHEGEEGNLFGEKIALSAINATLPADHLQVGDESSFKLKDVSAVLTAQGADRTIDTRWPVRIAGRFCRISHLGYTQPITVTTDTGSFSKTLDLDVLPPEEPARGSRSSISAHHFPLPKDDLKGLLTEVI